MYISEVLVMTQYLQNCEISSDYLVSKVNPAKNIPSIFPLEFRDSFHELIVRLLIFLPVSSIKKHYSGTYFRSSFIIVKGLNPGVISKVD